MANGELFLFNAPLPVGREFKWHHDESKREEGCETEMYCTYASLASSVKVGSKILCSDALLSFTVKEINGE